MGMFNDGSHEIDIIKEMAEGLGSQGLKLEDILEKADSARRRVTDLLDSEGSVPAANGGADVSSINEAIREYNSLIDQADDALRWLLIQREACGFRTHKNVNVFYPIPSKMKPVKHGS
jgi:hypothetical protein